MRGRGRRTAGEEHVEYDTERPHVRRAPVVAALGQHLGLDVSGTGKRRKGGTREMSKEKDKRKIVGRQPPTETETKELRSGRKREKEDTGEHSPRREQHAEDHRLRPLCLAFERRRQEEGVDDCGRHAPIRRT